MRSLGFSDRWSALACGFSALPLADHAEWQSYVGGREGQDGRSFVGSLGVEGIPIGFRHVGTNQPCVWHDLVAPPGDAFHSHVRGDSFSRMASVCRILGSWWADLRHFRRRNRGGARFPTVPCGVAARGNFVSWCVRAGRRSARVSFLQCCRSTWRGMQYMCGSAIVACGQ